MMKKRKGMTYDTSSSGNLFFRAFQRGCTWFVPVCLVLTLLFGLSFSLNAQDLEEIGDQKLFNYSGGISFTNTFYHAEGMKSQRDPYFWQLNANMNLSFLGIINAPFSFTLSQQNKNFSQPQPFNRFGISPTYKGITLHLGHRTLNFSDYTLAGNLFFGVGLEYQPENHPLRVSALYGRFAKPVDKFSQQGQVYAEPTYRRMGFGAKVGFETEESNAAVMFFKAADDVHSITLADTIPSESAPAPEENLVLGVAGGFRFFERFSFDAEYAYSLFTRDTRIPELFIDDYSFLNNFGQLFTPNASSLFTNALKSMFSYQGAGFQLNLSYRRVDPGYTTHGSSFLNNDMEDITTGIAFPLFNNRVSLSGNVGMQRNNLDEQNSAEVRRIIYSSSATINASEKLNLNLNYSNFSTTTRQMLIRSNMFSDTLEFYQVTKSAMISLNYVIGSGDKQSALFATANYQDANDNQNNASLFMSGNAGYSFKIGKMWSSSSSFSVNNSESGGFSNLTVGPVFSVNRSLLNNKIRTSMSLSVLNSYLNHELESNINNVRWSTNWTPGKRHTVAFNAFYIYRNAKGENAQQVQEIRATLNYSFRL